jgi:hypothetical protein
MIDTTMEILYFFTGLLVLIAIHKLMNAFEHSAHIENKKPHFVVRTYKGGYHFVAELVSLKIFDR